MIDYDQTKDDIWDQLSIPYVYFAQQTIGQRSILAKYISKVEPVVLILPSCYIFSYPAVLAGLSEVQIEYVAKNAPAEYKKEFLSSIMDKFKVQEMFNIAREMDDDFGQNITENQVRLKKILRYVNDNLLAFQF